MSEKTLRSRKGINIDSFLWWFILFLFISGWSFLSLVLGSNTSLFRAFGLGVGVSIWWNSLMGFPSAYLMHFLCWLPCALGIGSSLAARLLEYIKRFSCIDGVHLVLIEVFIRGQVRILIAVWSLMDIWVCVRSHHQLSLARVLRCQSWYSFTRGSYDLGCSRFSISSYR